jgi:hypothetical protein
VSLFSASAVPSREMSGASALGLNFSALGRRIFVAEIVPNVRVETSQISVGDALVKINGEDIGGATVEQVSSFDLTKTYTPVFCYLFSLFVCLFVYFTFLFIYLSLTTDETLRGICWPCSIFFLLFYFNFGRSMHLFAHPSQTLSPFASRLA